MLENMPLCSLEFQKVGKADLGFQIHSLIRCVIDFDVFYNNMCLTYIEICQHTSNIFECIQSICIYTQNKYMYIFILDCSFYLLYCLFCFVDSSVLRRPKTIILPFLGFGPVGGHA